MRLGDSPMDYVVVANAVPMPTDPPASAGDDFSLWDGGEFDFGDILDAINPLQHIPIISSIYRDLTGDDIGPGPRIAGGALFGGVIGAAVSLINVIIEDSTGKDIGEHAIAMVFGDDTDGPGTVAIAEAPEGASADEAAGAAPALAASMGYTPIESAPAPREAGAQRSSPQDHRAHPAVAAIPTARPAVPAAAARAAQDLAADPEAHGRQVQANQATQPLPPGPWIADSMLDALDQYRRMLQSRSEASAAVDLHT